MEPYTAEGMARQESESLHNYSDEEGSEKSTLGSLCQEDSVAEGQYVDPVTSTNQVIPNRIHYELVGIVVHSGQANAGHYYSFIKDRR